MVYVSIYTYIFFIYGDYTNLTIITSICIKCCKRALCAFHASVDISLGCEKKSATPPPLRDYPGLPAPPWAGSLAPPRAHDPQILSAVGWQLSAAKVKVKNYSPGYMEQAPSRAMYVASPQNPNSN